MAKLVKQYAAADASGRVDLICKNFGIFLGVVNSRTDGILYLIENEKSVNRRLKNGDLGVRVQTSNKVDPTGDTASGRADIKKALMDCNFSGGILDDTDHGDKYMREAFVLKSMREDYQLFLDQLDLLGDDKELYISFISRKTTIKSIASEYKIEESSAKSRIYRAKQTIKNEMISYLMGDIDDEEE